MKCKNLGFWARGQELAVQGSGLEIWGSGLRAEGFGCRVYRVNPQPDTLRAEGLGFRLQGFAEAFLSGLSFRVLGFGV